MLILLQARLHADILSLKQKTESRRNLEFQFLSVLNLRRDRK